MLWLWLQVLSSQAEEGNILPGRRPAFRPGLQGRALRGFWIRQKEEEGRLKCFLLFNTHPVLHGVITIPPYLF